MNKDNTYGYTPEEYAKFRSFAWKVLLSFGLTYMFFYNGRQNINLVMTQMAEELGSTTAAMGVVSSSLFWCCCISNIKHIHFFSIFHNCYCFALGAKWLLPVYGLG